MNRREFIKTAAAGSAGLMLGSRRTFSLTKKNRKRPNLLFIMTDQQRFDALSRAGNQVLQTPNLDRLASEGAFFENAYSACPVCGPARMCMLTGSTVEHTTIKRNPDSVENGQYKCMLPTYDELLVQEGYHAEYYGKWHAPLKQARIYCNPVTVAGEKMTESGPGMRASFVDYINASFPRRKLKDGEQYDFYSDRPYRTDPLDKRHGMKPGTRKIANSDGDIVNVMQPDSHGCLDIPPKHTVTAFQARGTIQALKNAKLQNKPFTIHCSFHFPHSPMIVSEPYYSMYPSQDMIPPESIDDPMTNSPYVSHNGRRKLPEYRDKKKIKYMISNYYGLIREIDDWVGKILDTLKEIGEEKNTLVIFTSDHGEMLGAHGMREKNIFYEESAHIPFMMRMPGRIKPGTVVSAPVQHIDYFDTILDYLGAKKHASDGQSLRGLIEGTEKSKDRVAVSEWNWRGPKEPNLMIVHDGWKFLCPNKADSKVMNVLYNMNDDPHEMNNLLGRNPKKHKHAAKAKEMKARLVTWLEEVESPHVKEVKNRNVMA